MFIEKFTNIHSRQYCKYVIRAIVLCLTKTNWYAHPNWSLLSFPSVVFMNIPSLGYLKLENRSLNKNKTQLQIK